MQAFIACGQQNSAELGSSGCQAAGMQMLLCNFEVIMAKSYKLCLYAMAGLGCSAQQGGHQFGASPPHEEECVQFLVCRQVDCAGCHGGLLEGRQRALVDSNFKLIFSSAPSVCSFCLNCCPLYLLTLFIQNHLPYASCNPNLLPVDSTYPYRLCRPQPGALPRLRTGY